MNEESYTNNTEIKRRKDFKPLEGVRFHCLTVICEDDSGKKQSGCRILYKCLCDCGEYTLADRWALESGHKTRCEKCSNAINRKIIAPQDRKIQKNNTSGCRGVDFNCGKWRARISINNHTYILGKYNTFEEAVAARQAAEFISKQFVS